MNPRDRRVRQSRFRCARAEHAQRGRVLLEDALRTASFGDEGRLLLIRALHLGRLPLHASATEWSRRCEEIMRRLRADAVSALSPDAPHAPAVWFRDLVEVWVSLGLRIAQGQPCQEWFWRAAAPEWSAALPTAPTLRLVFQKLADIGGLAATLDFAQALARHDALPALLAALVPEQVVLLPPVFDLPPPPFATSSREASSIIAAPRATLPITWLRPLRDAIHQWSARDPRTRWLALAVASTQAGGEIPSLREATATVLLSAVAREKSATETTRAAEKIARPDSQNTTLENAELSTPEDAKAPTGSDQHDVPTRYGGLFFLLPIFNRLHVEQMPPGVGLLALRLILSHLHRGAPDPLFSILPDIDPAAVSADFLPQPGNHHGLLHLARRGADWRVLLDHTGRLPLAAWQGLALAELAEFTRGATIRRAPDFPPAIHPAVAALALRAHRALRRSTRLGLPALVRRPARLAATRTHLGLIFPLAAADPRLRRAGLDLDPGWVPWLDRVVSFHYVGESEGHG